MSSQPLPINKPVIAALKTRRDELKQGVTTLRVKSGFGYVYQ